MTKFATPIGGLLAPVLALAMLGSRAEATPITYIETVTASGSIGPLGFQSDLITITATADTTGITSPNAGELAVNNLSATVNVAGVGTFGFTSPTNTFDFQTGTGTAGENSGTTGVPGSDILDVASAVFTTYDLATSLGPVSGEPVFSSGVVFPTTPFGDFAGGFAIDSTTGNATFQAILATPEPSSLILCGLGALGLAWAARRRG